MSLAKWVALPVLVLPLTGSPVAAEPTGPTSQKASSSTSAFSWPGIATLDSAAAIQSARAELLRTRPELSTSVLLAHAVLLTYEPGFPKSPTLKVILLDVTVVPKDSMITADVPHYAVSLPLAGESPSIKTYTGVWERQAQNPPEARMRHNKALNADVE